MSKHLPPDAEPEEDTTQLPDHDGKPVDGRLDPADADADAEDGNFGIGDEDDDEEEEDSKPLRDPDGAY
jgi:hypothetical protein